MKRYRLVLMVPRLVNLHRRDLVALAEGIRRRAPDIDVVVTTRHRVDQWRLLPQAFCPTLSVVFGSLARRSYLSGEILDCPEFDKHAELARLDAPGIPVPRWQVIGPGTQLDPDEWGPYVVVKPGLGWQGIDVRIRKTARVRYEPPASSAPGRAVPRGPRIAQRFVYTGPWAVSYRVCTFLGRAQYCLRVEQSHAKRPLRERWSFAAAAGGGGIQIIAASKTSSYALVVEPDLIALAERAHQLAFPDYPVLGFDLVRDAETGEPWVLEANSGGSVWHLSSKVGTSLQRRHGFDLYAQLGALDRAAEALIEVTRRRAIVALRGRRSLAS
jgi:hypothetical protein